MASGVLTGANKAMPAVHHHVDALLRERRHVGQQLVSPVTASILSFATDHVEQSLRDA
jgi:hypothetical protein